MLAATNDSNALSTGTVVKVLPGKMAGDGSILPVTVDEGDNVKFRDYAGNEIEIGDREFSVVRVADIMAKL